MQTQKFEGLIAAPFAPMDEKGNVNYDRIPAYYNFLKANKIAGAHLLTAPPARAFRLPKKSG
jgi:N-acetylneuraminate lyase